MYIIFGVSHPKKKLGQDSLFCQKCQRETIHSVETNRTFFTLFFIPVIPLSKVQGVARCNVCGKENILQHIPDASSLSKALPITAASPAAGVPAAPPPAEIAVRKSKKCPKCAEEILIDALACRFCGQSFSEEEVKTAIQKAEAEAQAAKDAAHQQALEAQRITQEKAARYEIEAKERKRRNRGWFLSISGGLSTLASLLLLLLILLTNNYVDPETGVNTPAPAALYYCCLLPLFLFGVAGLFFGIKTLRPKEEAAPAISQ